MSDDAKWTINRILLGGVAVCMFVQLFIMQPRINSQVSQMHTLQVQVNERLMLRISVLEKRIETLEDTPVLRWDGVPRNRWGNE